MQSACELCVGASLSQQRQDFNFPGGEASCVSARRLVRTTWNGAYTPFAQSSAHDGGERTRAKPVEHRQRLAQRLFRTLGHGECLFVGSANALPIFGGSPPVARQQEPVGLLNVFRDRG